MPVEQDEALRHTFDTVAQAYDQIGVEYFQPVAHRLVELAELDRGDYVLDIGCGRGAALFAAEAAVGPRGQVVGIDVSASMVAATAEEAGRRGANHVMVTRMDGTDPGFPPAYFDAVIGSNSVHMVPRLDAAFANYRRLLKRGGHFAVCAPATVREPEPRVFGLRSIAEAAARYSVTTAVYPQSEAFGGAENARTMLLDAGFSEVRIVVEEVVLRADSPAQFVDWTWTHGMRMMWDTVPESERDAVATSIAQEAAGFQDDDGRLSIPSPIRYLLARAR